MQLFTKQLCISQFWFYRDPGDLNCKKHTFHSIYYVFIMLFIMSSLSICDSLEKLIVSKESKESQSIV